MKFLRALRTLFVFLLTGILAFLVFLVLVIEVLIHGPSESARNIFVHSCQETSALKFVPRWFLGNAEVDRILEPAPEEPDEFVALSYDTAGDDFAEADGGEAGGAAAESAEQAENTEPIVIKDIKGGTYRGKLMIVADPKRVIVGTLKNYGPGVAGRYLMDFVADYGAVAGTNAGGFDDPEGHGSGGSPDGIVIENGVIRYGSAGAAYRNVIGIDGEGVLHVGNMSGQQALDAGIVTGVSFSPGEVLVQNGVGTENLQSGINPRTAIGQRADGAMLLLVVEGRHAGSLGASYEDLRDIMLDNGAVTASMLDGGTSSAMVYNGEQITRGSNLIGSRRLPTTILVMPERAS